MPGGVAARVAGWHRQTANLPGPVLGTEESPTGQPVTVELYINRQWVDVSSYVLVRDGSDKITITRGRADEAASVERSTCRFLLDNRDGRFSPRNPGSPYYGLIGRNTQVRVSVPIAGRKNYRFWGEISAWPQRWDSTGTDVWVEVDAAGILRRLAQGAAPTRSVLYYALVDPVLGGTLAYWPCEDQPGVKRIARALITSRTMTISGTPQLAAYEQFAASDPLPIMTSASFSGAVLEYTAVTAAQVRFLLFIPDDVTDGKVICAITHEDSTAPRTWELVYGTGGTLALQALNSAGATLFGGVSAFGDVRGKLLRVSIELQQNGSNINCAVRYLEVTATEATSATGTVPGQTLTRVTNIAVCPAAVSSGATRGLPDSSVGHITFQNTITPMTDLGERLDPAGETAGARFGRICGEHGVGFEAIGDLAETMPMGGQAKSKPVDLLAECADADGGMLYESLNRFGLGYRTRASLYNQGPALTLDYRSGQLAEIPVPVDDDQYTRNTIAVTPSSGGTAQTAELTTGDMSTLDPPDGVGVYGESLTLNVETDDDAHAQAHWRLHLGTVDEARYPQISVNLAHQAFAGDLLLKERALSVRVGDVITISDPPSWLPPDDITQMVLGMQESLDQFEHRITFTCAPASPWSVGTADDIGFGRVDTDGSELAAAATSGATSLDVVTTVGVPWCTDCAEGTWDVRVAGEVMTVTDVSDGVFDTFTRTESNGWGSADSGQAWTASGGAASEYSVSSGAGHHSMTSVNVSRWSTVPAVSSIFDLAVTVETDVLAAGGSHFAALVARFQDTGNNYLARLAFGTDQSVTLTIRKRTSSTPETSLASLTLEGATHAAGRQFSIRFQGNGTTLKAKGWRTSDGEPEPWTLSVTDPDLTAAGSIGVRSILSFSNTNPLPVTVSYDDFTVYNPQKFTVTRSVNSVVKAQAAGTAVALDRPAYVAL